MLIDIENDYKNPIFSSSYREEILWIAKENGIKIDSLCAHFLISGGILEKSGNSKNVKEYFYEILKFAPMIGVKNVSIPFMDQFSLRIKYVSEQIEVLLNEIISKFNINILIESDLSSEELNCFINKFNSEKIGILYLRKCQRYNFFLEDFKIIGNN